MGRIEEKLLERIDQDNTHGMNKDNYGVNKPDSNDVPAANSNFPEVPEPHTDGVKPQNPADIIMKEINVLDPMER